MVTFVVLVILCSCTTDKGPSLPFFHYILRLSILDASGNDLVKGIVCNAWDSEKGQMSELDSDFGSVKPDLYKLEVVFPEPWMDVYHRTPTPGAILDRIVPTLAVHIIDDYYYLYLETSSDRYDDKERSRAAEMLTFKLTCPYIFGNNAIHEIVTYWKEGNKPTNSRVCYRIEIGGNTFTEIKHQNREQVSEAQVTIAGRTN